MLFTLLYELMWLVIYLYGIIVIVGLSWVLLKALYYGVEFIFTAALVTINSFSRKILRSKHSDDYTLYKHPSKTTACKGYKDGCLCSYCFNEHCQNGCRYGQSDGPDDYIKECDCFE